jgi:hypothetical protein
MIQWLRKYRVSSVLDSRSPLPEPLKADLAASDELRRFARESETVGRELRETVPVPNYPDTLHDRIMSAVANASAGQTSKSAEATRGFGLLVSGPRFVLRRLGYACLGTATVCLLVWGWWGHPATQTDPATQRVLASATVALQASEIMAETLPQAMVAPLSQEWERLNQDLNRTKEFLLASVP